MPDLSIIIVNFNGEKYLIPCIESVIKYCENINHEIIVVDNNSADGSAQSLKEKFPHINLIHNKTNLGFAKGNNIGVKHAKGHHILLLNNDTLLLNELSPAINLLKNDSSIGIIGIQMLDAQNRPIISYGHFPKFYNFLKLKTLQGNSHTNKKNEIVDVDWISGAFLLTTMEIWNSVKGFNESYFMYVEDVDFNKKVKDLGKRSVYLSSTSFLHFVGFNKEREHLLMKSYKTYIRIHKTGIDLLASLFLLNINLLFKKALNRI